MEWWKTFTFSLATWPDPNTPSSNLVTKPLLAKPIQAPPRSTPWEIDPRVVAPPLCESCLVTSPSSISGSFYSDPSHLISPVHQDWSFEARYLYPLHDLPVQSLIICSRHPHCILDIFSPVVMVDRVGQQDGLLLILKGKVVQMFSTSTVSIPARLPMKATTSRGP